MSKIAPSSRVGFAPVDPATGVTGSRLYYGPEGSTWDSNNAADYDKPNVDVKMLPVQNVTLPDGTTASLRIVDTSVIPGAVDGNEVVALVDYDAAGNESDFSAPVTVPLDHVAPPAPTGGVVLQG